MPNETEFPAVTWQEVRERLVDRLGIEPEWKTESDDQLTWWPFFLELQFSVTASGLWEDDPNDNYLTVAARTPVAETDEALGLELCAEANEEFPLGAFVWEDGVISAVSTLALNPLCRPMLDLFVDAALIQTTIAHDLAGRWDELDGVEILSSAHPSSGLREAPDELLWIFADEEIQGVELPEDETSAVLIAARPLYCDEIVRFGMSRGFTNEEVDYFNGQGFPQPAFLAIGRMLDHPYGKRFGTGLHVLVQVTEPGVVFDPGQVNDINILMAQHPWTTLLGNVRADPAKSESGTQLVSYLTGGYLAGSRTNADTMAVAVINPTLHLARAVTNFWREVQRTQAGSGAE